MLQAYENSSMTFLRAPVLENIECIVHGFSTRQSAADIPPGEIEVRFSEIVGVSGWPAGRLKQIHSNVAHHAKTNAFAGETREGDAVYTSLKGFALGIRTADCVPVLIAERRGLVVAVAHAGWRGTCQGVVRNLVSSVYAEFGIMPADLVVALGPHIGLCCLEVGEEVFERFSDPGVFERRREWSKPHLNLAEANRKQLLEAGVKAEMIQVSKLCTHCRRDLFHSYRRDGDRAGRMYAIIGIRP